MRGNFSVDVKEGKIIVNLVHSQTGKILDTFTGSTPKELYKQIDFKVHALKPDHAMYIGTELEKAHLAIKNGKPYEQDRDVGF